ncbi:MAG: metallophosphoesterase [Crinalium sp.]
MTSKAQLLTDPFLQLPTENSVRVVWFTEFAGSSHTVTYGKELNQITVAISNKLSRTCEDQKSQLADLPQQNQTEQYPTKRDIWRHEAEVSELTLGVRVPYFVTSVREDDISVSSAVFSLAAKPVTGAPLKILLTSDHQLQPMVSANLQKVAETIGQVDAVFHAGDMVNVPDRASEWFDDSRGGAFFPCLQGCANYELEKNGIKTVYTGGQLIQNAPLFATIGNHEVMGRFSSENSLNKQFRDAFPRSAAEQVYKNYADLLNPDDNVNIRANWLKDNSFNTDTYEEIFSLPESKQGEKRYYSVIFGDVYLVVLYVTAVWRSHNLDPTIQGRYQERQQDLNNPENWGYGQHIFEPIVNGSEQYLWLETELNSTEFKQAKYKVVMLHHPPHTLGGNIVPAYTDPVQVIERDADGSIKATRYEYPKNADYITRDLVPLLEQAGVQLVFFGHSHLWNRFVSSSGTNFLETSNVGNSYGAAWGNNQRPVPIGYQEEYTATGDPYGLEPIVPTIAPLIGEDGQTLPYIASNDITVFSILDTETGIVSSYRFDTSKPNSEVVKFDEFELK